MSPRRAAAPKDPLNRDVREVMDVADDLQLHVSVLTVDGEKFAELRTFVKSQSMYGRGVALPMDPKLLRALSTALVGVARTEAK